MFLDNASTTQMSNTCLEILKEYNTREFYNPSALYSKAHELNLKINSARKNILKALGGTSSDKFIFTSGATEANNTVINTVKRNKKGTFLFSVSEHPSVYNCAQSLLNEGYDVKFISLNKDGTVDIDDFKNKLNENVCFVSIMHVNNETGAINPIKELVKLTKAVNKNALFHCDGVQAFGKIKVNVNDLGVDFYTVSGHKIHAPKGIGGIFVKNGVYIKPYLIGGGQEGNLRSGTENVAGILSFEKAVNEAMENIIKSYESITILNNTIRERLKNIKDCVIISGENASPYVLSVSFLDTRAETILHMLDDEGYIVGNGSACSSKKRDNRILKAMGYDSKVIEGTLRISFSKNNENDDVNEFINCLINVVNKYKGNVNNG